VSRVIGALPELGFFRRHRLTGRCRLGLLVAPPVFEEVEISGAFDGDEQSIVGPLRDWRECLRRRIVWGGRRHFRIVRLGEARKHGRFNREHVDAPARVAALLENRFRDILVGPLAIKLAGAAELRTEGDCDEDGSPPQAAGGGAGSRAPRILHRSLSG
jgi:hypothetical protein